MQVATQHVDTRRYAKCVEVSKRIRWDIDRDVLRAREFDFSKKFLPDGLSNVATLGFLSAAERRLLSQIQGRTYANMFGLVERFIGAKILDVSRDHWLGDQVALEALVRFSDEELKHQELFRRIETMIGAGMPAGYAFLPQPNEVASVVLGKSTWSVLALTCMIELFTQAHYRSSIDADRAAARAHAPRREQQVHARTARVVEHGLAGKDGTDAQRIADAGKARRRGRGQGGELGRVVAKPAHRVLGAAVEVELAAGLARDPLVRREHVRAEPFDVESDGTGHGHGTLLGQARIGASAAPMRAACSALIIDPSSSEKRGSRTPDTMYWRRYAARTAAWMRVKSPLSTGRAHASTK